MKPKVHLVIILGLIFFAISPFIIGLVGGYYFELTTGELCHEGNCSWAALGWVGIFGTIPLSILLFIVYIFYTIFLGFKNKRK